MAKGDQIKTLLGYLEQKDYPQTLAYVKKHPNVFRAALKAMTEDIVYLWNNFAVSLSKEDSHIEEPIYRRILELKPDDAITHYNLGNLLKDKGDLKGAEKHYRKAIEINPNYSAAHNNLGLLLHEGKGDFKGAEKEYRTAIEANPKNSAAHYNLGNLLSDKDKLKEAEQEYRKAIELDPEDPAAFNNLGILLKNKGKLKEAEQEYRKAIELDPRYVLAHNNLGNLLSDKDKLKEAEQEYRKAIELDPRYVLAHYNLGILLNDKGKLKEAEQEYRKAIKADPKDSAAHYNLGILLENVAERQKREEKKAKILGTAEDAYRKAIEINPNYSAAHNNLGNLLKNKGELDEAEKMLNKALKFAETFTFDVQKTVATNLVDFLCDKGYLLSELCDHKQTKTTAKEIIKLLMKHPVHPEEKNPLHADAYFLLGTAALQNGCCKKAIDHFRTAARFSPKDARIRYNLGLAYFYRRKLKEASQCVEKAVDLQAAYKPALKLHKEIIASKKRVRITGWRWIRVGCVLLFWGAFAGYFHKLIPKLWYSAIWVLMIPSFIFAAFYLVYPLLPAVKWLRLPGGGEARLNIDLPQERESQHLPLESRRNLPAKSADSPQASESTRSE